MTVVDTTLVQWLGDPWAGDGPFGGAGWAVADLVYRREGVDDPVVLWLAALAVWAQRCGHACVDLAEVGDLVDTECARAGVEWERPELPAVGEMRNALRRADSVVRVVDGVRCGPVAEATGDVRPLVLWGELLYTQRQFVNERVVADRIVALSSSPVRDLEPFGEAFIDTVLPVTDPGDTAANEAARSVLRSGFNVLTGGPGTGKTSTLTRALLAFLVAAEAADTEVSVALVAPTGKAATRAGEMLGAFIAELGGAQGVSDAVRAQLATVAPSTIHRLLGAERGVRTRFAHDAARPLGHDLIIVDETSMVDLQLMARLLEAVKPGGRVLLVGDAGQLESVESGAVLRDLTARPGLLGGRVHELRVVHRLAGDDNPIADLAPALRAGDLAAARAALDAGHRQITFVEVADGDRPDPMVLDGVLATYADVVAAARSFDPSEHARALRLLAGTRVLCGARRGPLGVEHFNDLIDDRLKIQSFDLTAVGRAVLITVNAPRVRLVNGDIGLVVNTDDGVRVAFPDLGDPNQPAGAFAEGVRYLSPAELPEYERAYAMTVHKSQGSEYARDVVVILPQPGSPLLTRELVYTAVTRARSQVTLVGSVAAFAEALANPSARVSGLALMVGAGDAPSA